MSASSFLATTASAAQASISVILILGYGFLARRVQLFTQDGESNISKLGTQILLPALLFSEIGPLASVDNLRSFWPIIPFALIFQLLSLGLSLLLERLSFISAQFRPMFGSGNLLCLAVDLILTPRRPVFNNVTSLPLLLLESLERTGTLEALAQDGENLKKLVSRGRVFFLINALVGNLCRFAFGPYLMTEHEGPSASATSSDADSEERSPLLPRQKTSTLQSHSAVRAFLLRIGHWLCEALNPPLQGGLAAIACGIIGPVRRVVFEQGWGGWVDPVTSSVEKVGSLYTVLQVFVLGAHLYSKPSQPVRPAVLVVLFVWRFLAVPAISISLVYLVRTRLPSLLAPDPMLDFVLCLGPVGPPALSLAAIAAMSSMSDAEEGQVARIIAWSYAVTPAVSLSVIGALWAVGKSGIVGSGEPLVGNGTMLM